RWVRIRRWTQILESRRSDLEVFSSAMAHELRAPLRAMSALVALVQEALGDGGFPEVKADLAKIQGLAEQAHQLTQDLLNLARLGKDGVHLEVWSPRVLVEGALTSCKEALERRHARVETVGEGPPVLADGVLCRVALSNFIHNAIKFQPPHQTPQLRLVVSSAGLWCRIAVEDNGLGIAPKYLERLFRPFSRFHGSHFPGFGLGLAAAAKATKLMNGRIGATSQVGEGSVFWLELPLAAGEGANP
ncbi:MAG: HAMP domain-containing histidine kinase, partial [Thermoanaerobaculum sp.]|nr:HAMP domain-containing histidine kinase [Thermoanaerobaculum sp.]